MWPWNMNKNCKISNIKIEILLKKTKNYWYHLQFINSWQYTYIRWFRIFQTSRYQGIVKVTRSGVFEDLKLKISEGSDKFSLDSKLGRLRTTSILIRAFWNFKLKVLICSRSCSLPNTLIPWSLKNPESPSIHVRLKSYTFYYFIERLFTYIRFNLSTHYSFWLSSYILTRPKNFAKFPT